MGRDSAGAPAVSGCAFAGPALRLALGVAGQPGRDGRGGRSPSTNRVWLRLGRTRRPHVSRGRPSQSAGAQVRNEGTMKTTTKAPAGSLPRMVRRKVVAYRAANTPDSYWLSLACGHRTLWSSRRRVIPASAACRECSPSRKPAALDRRSPASGGSAPSLDDWMEAYDEAAGHLEYLAGIPTDHTDGEREAKRRLAKRLRASANRMAQNDQAERLAANKKNV